MEKKIGDTFEFKGKKLQVKKSESVSCYGCFFAGQCGPLRKEVAGECQFEFRTDNNEVIFVEVQEQPQKLNLFKILKNCPKGEEFWSPLFGYVKLHKINHEAKKVVVISNIKMPWDINNDGTMLIYGVVSSEIMLFPSKEQRDWSKFTAPWLKKERFNPKSLQPFDRVIVYGKDEGWFCTIFSHIGEGEYPYNTVSGNYAWCVPYNDETKHLVGTTEEAPDFYKYWED